MVIASLLNNLHLKESGVVDGIPPIVDVGSLDVTKMVLSFFLCKHPMSHSFVNKVEGWVMEEAGFGDARLKDGGFSEFLEECCFLIAMLWLPHESQLIL